MKKDDLSPEARAAWINLPHARTIAERLERQLELLRVLDGAGAQPLNLAVIALRNRLEPWLDDADPETAAQDADPIVDLARDLVKAIVDDALPGKNVDIDDNLFEVGASSLTLIQIHEKIDELYPGVVDLTELFDFPTISLLAQRLESKIGR